MCGPAKALGENLSLLFELLVAVGIPWLVAVSHPSLPLSSHDPLLHVSSSVSYLDTYHWIQGTPSYSIQHDLILGS